MTRTILDQGSVPAGGPADCPPLHGFLGVLESPLPAHPVAGTWLEVRGWALLDGQPPERVTAAWDDDTASVPLQVGIARQDVAAAFMTGTTTVPAGFAGKLQLPRTRAAASALRVTLWGRDRSTWTWQRALEQVSADEAYRRWLAAAAVLGGEDGLPGDDVLWLVADAHAGVSPAHASAADLRAWGPSSCRGWRALRWSGGPVPAGGGWVGLVRAGDRPHPDLPQRLATALRLGAPAVVIDHDHSGPEGEATDPVFKPGWSPSLLDAADVTARAWVVRRDHVGERVAKADDAACWLRRATSVAAPAHLAGPGLRAPGQPRAVAMRSASPPVIGDAASLLSSTAVIVLSRLSNTALLLDCLARLRGVKGGDALELLVGLNNLQDPVPPQVGQRLLELGVQVAHLPGAFNWSTMNNALARRTERAHLLFLNDDIEPPADGGWLAALHAALARPGVEVAGAVLTYPDGSVQHAGVTVACNSGVMCRHRFRHASDREPRIARWLALDREETAVTGACLLTTAATFIALGGFDERLALVFNDVDYCLRVRQRGGRCVVAAAARLVHHEGLSRGGLSEQHDLATFAGRWASQLPPRDPFDNPMLDPDRDDWMVTITASGHGRGGVPSRIQP